MKTILSKMFIGRIIAEALLIIITFVGFDQMTIPSEGTATAVMEAVKKHQLDPICIVEVRSAIHLSSFLRTILIIFGFLGFLLLCSDLWMIRRYLQDALYPKFLNRS